MKVLLVLAALVAYTSAVCTPMGRLKVKEQWHKVYSATNRVQAGKVIWRAMFAKTPGSLDLFERVNGKDINSAEFGAHSIRVLGGLEMAIDLLDHEDILHPALAHLNEQHVSRHIPRSYVSSFKEVLMGIIPAAMGRCFDHEAWDSCLDIVLDGIFGEVH